MFEFDGLGNEEFFEWFIMGEDLGCVLVLWICLLKFEYVLVVFEWFLFVSKGCDLERVCKFFFLVFWIFVKLYNLLEGWVLDFIGFVVILFLVFILEFFILFILWEGIFVLLDMVLRFEFIEVDLRDRLEMIVEVEWILESLNVGFFFLVGFFEFVEKWKL